jgi:hypothetical protein
MQPLCRHRAFLRVFNDTRYGKHLDECWEWTGTRGKGGYGVVVIEGTQYRASRVTLNEYDPSVQVLHTCDNPPCVNPVHLQRGTIQENQYDKGRKGRAAKGVLNRGGGKLKEDDVRAIRVLLASPENPTLNSIGRRFGVSGTLIAHIRDGRLWKEVQ